MFRLMVLVFAVMFGLSACQTGGGQKETAGTLLGGVAGAIAGASVGKGSGRIVATATGTLLGAFIGNQIGVSLDRADRLAHEQSYNKALETQTSGTKVTWNNPDSGNSGSITPLKTYETAAGPCREFTQEVTIGGQTETAYGTACRQADGSWKISN